VGEGRCLGLGFCGTGSVKRKWRNRVTFRADMWEEITKTVGLITLLG